MLQSIRDHTQGWVAGIIVSLLILSFALWGIHSYFIGNTGNVTVAKVDGVEITKAQLAVTYERLRRQMQDHSSTLISENAEADLKQHALQALIEVQIMRQTSLKEGYRISTQQIDRFLESLPQFQVNGRFSLEHFQRFLSTTLFSIDDFFQLIKTTLLIDQPRLGILLSSFSLPNEVTNAMSLINQERDISYITIPTSLLAHEPVTIDNADINAYYKSHQADYQTPEQVSIEYIVLSLKDIADHIYPTESEIKSFYNENTNLFTKVISKEAKVIPFDEAHDQVREAVVRQQAEAKFADLKEKLANITYEHPDTLKAAADALGLTIQTSELFTKDKPGKDILGNANVREIAFSRDVLNAQNNSDVIQLSPDRVAVIRIKSHISAAVLSLKDVQKQIEDHLKTEAIDKKTFALSQQIASQLRTTNSLPHTTPLMNQYHLNWNAVGYMGRHSNKLDSSILETAFEMPFAKAQSLTTAIAKIPNGYAIVTVNAVRERSAQPDEYGVYSDQLLNAQGVLEYDLYKQEAMNRAKVTVENPAQ